jgi:serine/threonine protein kinase
MSPEQLTAGGKIDARTDVYSLGVVLYELLTGRLPFVGKGLTALRQQILAGSPPPMQGVPAELERICLKCLARNAEERYATARELAHDLRALLEAV